MPRKAPRKKKKKKSHLEIRFEEFWVYHYPKIDLCDDWKFHEDRDWEFDYSHLEAKVAIEIEGGVWVGWSKGEGGGRHNNPVSFEKDTEKYLEATLLGWVVVRLTEKFISEEGVIHRIADLIKDRLRERDILASLCEPSQDAQG